MLIDHAKIDHLQNLLAKAIVKMDSAEIQRLEDLIYETSGGEIQP